MIDDLTPRHVAAPAGARGDDRRPLSSRAVDQALIEAAGLLAAVDGLALVPAVPTTIASTLLAPQAERLRLQLVRVGAIDARHGGAR